MNIRIIKDSFVIYESSFKFRKYNYKFWGIVETFSKKQKQTVHQNSVENSLRSFLKLTPTNVTNGLLRKPRVHFGHENRVTLFGCKLLARNR